MSPRSACCLPLFLALLGGARAAQLDLPGKPAPARKEPASAVQPPAPPRGDVAPKENGAPLDLPGAAGAPEAPAPAPATSAGPEADARTLFGQLERLRDLQSAPAALQHLLALGPAMLPVARLELATDRPAALLVAGNACLAAGGSAERAAVAERLRRALPGEVAAPLLEELLARDPVLSSPEFLAGLLDHPTPAMRAAAARALEPRMSEAHLAALAPALASPHTFARAAAVELVARVAAPTAWNLLASRLADPSSELAQRVATLLAGLDPAEALLLERAFPAAGDPLAWDRGRAYALLALVEREDARHLVLLDDSRIEALRAGLAGPPLIAGACAVALARVGFRAPASRTGAWLDRDVPHQLVRSGTGAEFHSDFSALERPALRALALLSGESFGLDGDAARRWWLDHAGTFHARHAVIELPPDAAAQLLVLFDDPAGQRYALLGPQRAPPGGSARPLQLDAATAEGLLARLGEQGVLGTERLPGGSRTGAERLLRVAVGAQEKEFAHAPGAAPWLDELRAELAGIVEANRWQLYFDPARTSAREFWQAEHERWAAYAPLERRRALKALVLAAAQRARGAGRDAPLAELVALYGELGVPEGADFEPLLALLAGEPGSGPRGAQLVELARIAAGASEGAARERLVALVLERFAPLEPTLERALEGVARELDPAALRALAQDARPAARALAAAGLVLVPEQAPLVLALLSDREASVQAAALRALARSPREDTRTAVLELARGAGSAVRLEALAALARLGGKDAQDAALEAVGDPAPEVQAAGVAALAVLADPGSASLFASLLARGPASPLFADARAGLKRLGPAGADECLRLARSASKRARREATLLLAEELAPEAAELLLAFLADEPGDERALFELSVLSGLDLAAEADPLAAARAWWELVLHDDPLAWLLAAGERAGLRAPGRGALEGAGTAEGARFLLALAELPSAPLVERAARELERRLGQEFARPASGAERARFHAELAEAVRARYGE